MADPKENNNSLNPINKNDTADKVSVNLSIKKPPQKMTKKQMVIILNLAYGNFCLGALYSTMAPFFPREAETKGASPTQYGLIFGIYELGIFALSPFIGKMIPHVSPKFLIIIGLFVAGFCNALFGLLQWSPHGFTFVGLALATRFFASVGGAAFTTACFTLIAKDFPDRVSTLFATTEMFLGFGLIVGPAIGGFLFQVGGFSLPFFMTGGLTILGAVTTWISLPETKQENVGPKVQKKVGVLRLLSKFGITLNVIVGIISFLIIGFNDATLEPHIRHVVALSPSATGAIFLLGGLIYAACSQFWGFLSEKAPNAQLFCVIGYIFSLAGFLFIGPMYGVAVKPTLWLIIVSQILISVGIGGQIVGSFTQGLRETLKSGFPDDISTLATVSSVFTSSFSLGAAIGPVLGGYLIEHYGYPKACVVIEILQVAMVATIIIFNICNTSATKELPGSTEISTMEIITVYGSERDASRKQSMHVN